jgi:hypothetical protein
MDVKFVNLKTETARNLNIVRTKNACEPLHNAV